MKKIFLKLKNNVIFSGLFLVLLYLLAYLLESLSNNLKPDFLRESAVILTVIFIILVILSYFFLKSYLDSELNDKVNLLKDFIEANGLGNIINEKTLSTIESQSKEIWVITPNLKNDLYNDTIKETVSNNLKNGKKYIYFVPQNTYIEGSISEYYKIYNNFIHNKDQVKFIQIPTPNCNEQNKNNIYFYFPSEIVLYDVDQEDKPSIVIQQFPNKKSNYYLLIEDSYKEYIIGLLKCLKKSHDF
jgi:hypothetical protein